MEIHLPFGLRNDKIVHISEISKDERGLKCNCVCPSCGVALQARIGEIRKRHFSHHNENCQGALESSFHILAKDILLNNNRIFLPDFYYENRTLIKGNFFEYKFIELEKRIGNVIVDVFLSDGKNKLFVEIVVTHDIDEHKFSKLINIGDSVLRIDLREIYKKNLLSTDSEEISKLIIEDSNLKTWTYNKKATLKISEIKRKRNLEYKREYENQEKIRLIKEEEFKRIMSDFELEFKDNKELVHKDQTKSVCKSQSKVIDTRNFKSINPSYLNYKIPGELILNCDRRIWQTAIFKQFIINNTYKSFGIKNIIKWIKTKKTIAINEKLQQVSYEVRSGLRRKGFEVATLEEIVFKFLINIAQNISETINQFNKGIEILNFSSPWSDSDYDHYQFRIRDSKYYSQLVEQKKNMKRVKTNEYIVLEKENFEQTIELSEFPVGKSEDLLYQEALQAREFNPDGPWCDSEEQKYGICDKCGVFTHRWISYQNNTCKCKECYK